MKLPTLTGRAAALLGCWIVTAPLVVFVVLRTLHVEDHNERFFALVTFTPVLLLPAWVVLVVAAAVRRPLLGATALILVLAHVGWVAPDVRWWPNVQPEAEGPLSVVAANVLRENGERAVAARALGALDTDVLIVEELTPSMLDALHDQGVLARYPYASAQPSAVDTFGIGFFSRYPLHDPHLFDLAGFDALRADVILPGGAVTVIAVHTLQPLAGLSTLRRQLRQLGTIADEVARSGGRLVIAGDLNATRQHAAYRDLLDHGLRDAHAERGRGRARSWPTGRVLPPFALLDHVLVSDEVAVLDAGTAPIPGSDHRAVTAQLAVFAT